MTDAALLKRRRYWSAVVFAGLMLCLMVFAIVQRDALINAITRDPLALLPLDQFGRSPEDAALIKKADEYQSRFVSDKIIVFVAASTPEQTALAAKVLSEDLSVPDSPVKINSSMNPESFQQFIDFYAGHSMHLLTSEHATQLKQLSTPQLTGMVMENALRPLSIGVSVSDDPLGNLNSWFLQQTQKSPLQRNEQGAWEVTHNDTQYTVLFFQAADAAFSLDTDRSVLAAYNKAKQAVLKQVPSAQLLVAGIPMHAAAAAEQANQEISWFGGISTVGLVLLILCGFQSLRAMWLIGLSLAFGLLLAYLVTYWVFGQVHVVTLVFGTSLIGVAEDYGLHFIATRQNEPKQSSWDVRRHIRAGLLLALLTTVVAYLCLGIVPFPGLQQISVFAAAGLVASWMVVMLLFPALSEHLTTPSSLQKRMSSWWLGFVQKPLSRRHVGVLFLVLLVFMGFGYARLTVKDDLRMFQNSPKWLIEEQITIGQALNESNTQYFIVTGKSEQDLLEHEEALKKILDQRIIEQQMGGYRAVSDWLPSIQQQKLVADLSTEKLTILNQSLGLNTAHLLQTKDQYITPQAWLAHPVAQVAKAQWLGQQADGRWASIVSLYGRITPDGLSALQNVPQALSSVIWVNKVSDYSQMMAEYRVKILWVLLIAYGVTLVVLWWRYQARAVYVLLPPALASVLTLACLGWLMIPLQLFTVLPLLLILGMGVDYGIFLVEHVHEQQKMWMTISLGAMSTILSLGMLGFSSTPALHVLGLTLSIGIALTWVIAAFVGRVVYQGSQSTTQHL